MLCATAASFFSFWYRIVAHLKNTKCVGKKIDKKDIFRYSDKSWAKITWKDWKNKVLFRAIVRIREKIQDNYMKNNGPCADIAGSAGEGLRKTKEEHQWEKGTKSDRKSVV